MILKFNLYIPNISDYISQKYYNFDYTISNLKHLQNDLDRAYRSTNYFVVVEHYNSTATITSESVIMDGVNWDNWKSYIWIDLWNTKWR